MATKIWVGTDSGNEGDINTAANWSPSGVPVATDDVYFENSSQSVTDGLATWAAVALGTQAQADPESSRRYAACVVMDVDSGQVLAKHNADGPWPPASVAKLMLVYVVRELVRDRPAGLLVEVGGEVRALGTTLLGEPWRVGIQDPTASGDDLEAVLALTGAALATSGDYRNLRVVAGKRRSHVIDPRTGRPLDNRVASASVVAPTCMEADAAATALMVLGPDVGMAWVEERPWLDALLLLRRGDRIVERRASSRWARWEAPDP